MLATSLDERLRVHLTGIPQSDCADGRFRDYLDISITDSGSRIDWGQDQAFVFGSKTLTPGLMERVSVVRVVPNSPPTLVNHANLDEWRWTVASDHALAALAPPVEPWQPACSVLTSLFDGDEYLEGFLDNCASWAGYDDMEHFIVRPASPGDEHGRLVVHGQDHPSVVYLWLAEDPGLYEIWNQLALLSTAKYLSNANVDDRRAPKHVERLTGCLESSSDSDVVSSSLRNTDVRNLDWADSADILAWPPNSQDHDYRLDGLFRRRGGRLASFNLPHCMPVWRAALHVTNGYFDEAHYGPSADWEFWLRCGQRGARFHLVGEPLGLHLKVPDSYWRRHDRAANANASVLDRYTRAGVDVVVEPPPRPLAVAVSSLVNALHEGSCARLFWALRDVLVLRKRRSAGSSVDAMLSHLASTRLMISDFGAFESYLDSRSPSRSHDKLDMLFVFVCHCLAYAEIRSPEDAAVYIAFADEYDTVLGTKTGRLIKALVHSRLGDTERERFYLQALLDSDAAGFWANVQRVYRFARPLRWFMDNMKSCPSSLDFGAVRQPTRVFYYPKATANPYQELLYRSMRQRGVESVGLEKLSTIDRRSLRAGDIVHIHWLRRLIDERPLREHEAVFNAFVDFISAIKSQGVQVYWTVHNRVIHDYPDESRDLRFRQRLSALVDRVILHHPMQLDLISDWLSENATVEITEHGNYLGCYPNAVEQQAARDKLGLLSNDTVLLIAGLIRPYKDIAGKAELLDAWLSSSPHRKLLVAGAVSCEKARKELAELPAGQVILINRFIDDDELQLYFNAASIVLLSYRDVLTSGSLMEALSFSRPVLAPAMGSIPYYVADGFNGWLYRDDRELYGLLNTIGDASEALLGLQGNCLRAAKSAQWP